MKCFKNRGFTLIELMITLLILGILLSIAVPSFTEWMQRKRVIGVANEFAALIQFSRSEAIKRNANIFLQTTRISDTNWSLMSSDQQATCTALNPCDLRNMLSSNYKETKVKAIKNAAGTNNNLNNTRINPANPILNFSNATTDTSVQYVTFESGNYQLNTQVSVTGLTTICIPTGKPAIGGYLPC
ncbi:pilus assembly FimT family protein [Deefgea piscis]|uniref:pilus assembly FimT family protein n=1 Tax=Deefgea piscis TaxID=2739061 RepID=UPI001C822EF6|nr:GspH/FimT family pseudopilin [Deefgea piscis]QZA80380.1 GspH/FimT family pseudopilin [Deefgea piscis]